MTNNFWQSERIRLRQIEADDWKIFQQWDLDSDVLRNLDDVPFPKSSERYQQWAQDKAKEESKNDEFMLVIEDIETGAFAGAIDSHSTDRRVGTFAYGVAILPDFQRRGYAKDAILLLLRYFFEELGYQKCTVDIHEWNEESVKLHESMGFVKEGQLRRVLYTKGRYWDAFYYGITVEEWRERYQPG